MGASRRDTLWFNIFQALLSAMPFVLLVLAGITVCGLFYLREGLPIEVRVVYLLTCLGTVLLGLVSFIPILRRLIRSLKVRLLCTQVGEVETHQTTPLLRLGASPYPDTAIAILCAPRTQVDVISLSWWNVVGDFWEGKLDACVHNQTLLDNALEESVVYFIPLYAFTGNFVLASAEFVRGLGVRLEELPEVEYASLVGAKVPRDAWATVLGAAKKWSYTAQRDVSTDIDWILRQTVLTARIPVGQIGENRIWPVDEAGKEEVVSVGGDEAFAMMEDGEYVLLSSSRNYDHASVVGIFARPNLSREAMEAVFDVARRYLKVGSILQCAAGEYVAEEDWQSGALLAKLSKVMGSQGRIAATTPLGIARALTVCVEIGGGPRCGWHDWLEDSGERILSLVGRANEVDVKYQVVSIAGRELLSLHILPRREGMKPESPSGGELKPESRTGHKEAESDR